MTTPILFSFAHAIFAVASLLVTSHGGTITIRKISAPNDIEVHLELGESNVDALRRRDVDLPSVLSLSVVRDDGSLGAPVFAKYQWRVDRLVMVPRYRLANGTKYVVRAQLTDEQSVEKIYCVPETPPAKAPRVQRVFPSSRSLPANCLKFYVHFDQPIRQGRKIFDQIHLLDESGQVVPDPWRRTELWNATGDRLTLWIHPGRIKQGVNLRDDLGPVLKPSHRYTLLITNELRSLSGARLEQAFRKEFSTIDEDHTRPDPSRWKLSRVRTARRSPLVVKLDEPLDRALLDRMITVMSKGRKIDGSSSTSDNETVWRFVPSERWPDAPLHLSVNERLEDLAGNTPARVFDTDLSAPALTAPSLRIPIERVSEN